MPCGSDGHSPGRHFQSDQHVFYKYKLEWLALFVMSIYSYPSQCFTYDAGMFRNCQHSSPLYVHHPLHWLILLSLFCHIWSSPIKYIDFLNDDGHTDSIWLLHTYYEEYHLLIPFTFHHIRFLSKSWQDSCCQQCEQSRTLSL